MVDLVKIGKFIAELRKEKKLTQMELAEKLNITDRAVSKWECGKSLPDSSVMTELCEILGISVNELLTGEKVNSGEYNKRAELNMLEMKKQKEESDKALLRAEILIVIIGCIFFFGTLLTASFCKMDLWLKIVLCVLGVLVFFVSMFEGVRIEQKIGYYECKNCKRTFIPSYSQTLRAMHVGRTRYLQCPYCGKKTWAKKVLEKNENKE